MAFFPLKEIVITLFFVSTEIQVQQKCWKSGHQDSTSNTNTSTNIYLLNRLLV